MGKESCIVRKMDSLTGVKKKLKWSRSACIGAKINRSVFEGRINTFILLAFAIYFHFPMLSF